MKTISEINKAIDTIARSGAKLDALIQETGVDVLTHFAEHKDTGVVNRFFLAMPKGARKTAMVSWLLAYCAVSANADKANKATSPFIYDREKHTNPAAAAEDMWFNHKPDNAPDQVFDLQKAVRALLAKAAKATTTNTNHEQLAALAAAAGIPESDVPTLPKMPAVEDAAM